MLKQTRFYLGMMLILQAISCVFLAICFLFSDKKKTALPFTWLGVITSVAGAVMVAEKVRENFENEAIIEAMNDLCDDELDKPDIPVDETADETEFDGI